MTFRADAAFVKPKIYEVLEQRDVDYAIRSHCRIVWQEETRDN